MSVYSILVIKFESDRRPATFNIPRGIAYVISGTKLSRYTVALVLTTKLNSNQAKKYTQKHLES